MKKKCGILSLSLCVNGAPGGGAEEMKADAEHYITERGPHHRVWAQVSRDTDARGRAVARTNRYTELATGLHYPDPGTGQWLESREVIEPVAGGAVASQGQHQVEFAANLATEGAITLTLPDGRRVRSHVLGLAWWDAAREHGVLLGAVKDSVGKLLPPNQVLYEDAFTGVRADVRYTYTRAGFEQDVILRERPPDPERFGLGPATTRLQVWTEFVAAPAARVAVETVRAKDGSEARDARVDWGTMAIGVGQAFAVGEAGAAKGEVPDGEREDGAARRGVGAVAVNKQWVGLEGRQFLVEEVPWGVVREQVERLPAARQAGRPQEAPVVGAVALWLPPAPAGRAAAAEAAPMQLAAVSPAGPGFVVDYVVLNTTQNHYTFRGDMTYDVSAQVTLNGTTTFEGGAVIKFRRTHAGLSLNGPWVCRTGPYRSVIFTARDDDSVGTRIAGSTGTPTGYYGNGVTLTKAGTLTNARFAFLPTALSYAPWGVPSNSNVLHLAHLQFVRCRTPLYVTDTRCFICGATVNLDNALIAQCDTFLEGEEVAVHARHVTVDQCTTLARREGGNCTLALTNSILSAVASLSSGGASVSGAHNAFHNTPSFGEDPIPLMAGPFQSVGAGHYYLAAAVEPMLRNRGTPNLPGALLAALRQQTTRPPLVLANHITEDTVLGPQAPGDLCAPDLGYHYEPLDYVVSGRALSARLTLTNGVVLGTYGAANTRGLFVGFGGHLISEGSSVALNRIVRYNTVQEQSASPWSSSTAGIGIELANSSAQAQFRFTAWSLLGGNGIHFARGNGAAGFRDCQLAGGQFRWLEGLDLSFEGNLGLTNCLWERVQADLQAEDGGQVFAYNNLFRGGSWFWNNETENEWIVQDNLFDAVSLSRGSGTLTHGWNGYLGTAQLAGGSGGDVDITPPGDYQEGPLGNFYYPTSGDKLHRLVDAGSRSAAEAGLADYTTRPDQGPDTGQVDIGFHYKRCGCCTPSQRQFWTKFWTDDDPTPEELAQMIVGNQATVIPNSVIFRGAPVARGRFGNGAAACLPISEGVILSSGDIALAPGPNDRSSATGVNGTNGDADLDTLLGAPVTYDAAVLEFDVISPVATTLGFDYIFASEEYPEFVDSEFNDLVGIFVEGVNIATVPGTALPVCVKNVNGGYKGEKHGGPDVPATNPQYYRDNHDPTYSALPEYAASVAVYNIQYDGTTVLLRAQTNLAAAVTYRVKIAIADANDDRFDSAVFIRAQIPCPQF